MYRELDRNALTRNIPERALHIGDIGAIALRHSEAVDEVEFSAPTGAPPAITAVATDAMRRVKEHGITPVAPPVSP